ncbi:hypothetical protein [Methylobacterium planeticum]|uniref:Uncharacterized protein n=1 Tax=Methylobacterium planeticum TaxID=2615211 RepID=A0A6N6MDN2_9HYPH|nr:hypothetical protein [Methylobacterium planeticum]KAB1068810.1 hypothetical protein F6X51_26205 [Methylobacterium planeticum]
MTCLECSPLDSIMARYGSQLAAIGPKAPIVFRDALNREGRKGRKEIRQALVRQTGLRLAVIRRAIDPRTRSASVSSLQYRMDGVGGEISLRYFSPRETRSGVKHRSPNVPSPVPHAFTKGGSFRTGRKAVRPPVTTGHVWIRKDPSKFPLHKEKSGVWIPKEMVRGESLDRYRAIAFRLDGTVGKQIARFLPH